MSSSSGGAPRGRYAPSPTGEIHLGNASTALAAWLAVRSRGGAFVLRMEDLDAARVQPGAARRILDDLLWLGLDWDEGPDRGGPHDPYVQSLRSEHYDRAFSRLRGGERLYPCFCSRKDVAAAASAPQAPGDEVRYPGTCRSLPEMGVEGRLREGRPHSWRFRVEPGPIPGFVDLVRGPQEVDREIGDFVVRRADGTPAYQLAVVVDDALMGIDQVVRGDDLLASTSRQLMLYDALELPRPRFAHVPLLLGPDGIRLSKRHEGTTIRELREAGIPAAAIVGRLACLLGLTPDPAPLPPELLVDRFAFDRIVSAPEGRIVDASTWNVTR